MVLCFSMSVAQWLQMQQVLFTMIVLWYSITIIVRSVLQYCCCGPVRGVLASCSHTVCAIRLSSTIFISRKNLVETWYAGEWIMPNCRGRSPMCLHIRHSKRIVSTGLRLILFMKWEETWLIWLSELFPKCWRNCALITCSVFCKWPKVAWLPHVGTLPS